MKKIFTLIAVAMMAFGAQAQTTLFSWEGGADGATVTGGTVTATDKDGNDVTADDVNMKNSTYNVIRLRGAKDFSTFAVSLNLTETLAEDDVIAITAYRNKNEAGKKSGALLKFNVGDATVSTDSGTGLEFNNVHADVPEELGEPNTIELKVPAAAAGSNVVTMTRAQTATNLFITKIVISRVSTGIETVKAAADNGATYNVAGQQVGAGYKGLVIKNGRKYIVK